MQEISHAPWFNVNNPHAVIIELRESVRALRRNLFFTGASVASLSVGLCGVAVAFSAYWSLYHGSLPFSHPSELVALAPVQEGVGDEGVGAEAITANSFVRLHAGGDSFTPPCGWAMRGHALLEFQGVVRTVSQTLMTDQCATVLDVRAAVGRTFNASDEDPDESNLMLLSYDLWRGMFGGDSAVVGRTITLDGTAYSVTGVMPQGFGFPLKSQIWTRLHVAAGPGRLFALVRLRAGASIARGNAELAVLSAGPAPEGGSRDRSAGIRMIPFRQIYTVGDLATLREGAPLTIVALSVLIFLTVANVVTLQLAQYVRRTPAVALRMALGADRWRVLVLVVSESGLIALGSCMIGFALSWLFWRSVAIQASSLPSFVSIRPTMAGGVVTVLFALFLGVTVGMYVGRRAYRMALQHPVVGGSHTMTSGGSALRMLDAVVVSQLTAAFCCTAVLIWLQTVNRSLRQSTQRPAWSHVYVAPVRGALDAESQHRVVERAIRILGADAAVTAAAATDYQYLPPTSVQRTVDHPSRETEWPSALVLAGVTGDFFDARPIRLLAGRYLQPQDIGAMTVVIDSQVANRGFGGRNPIGATLRITINERSGVRTAFVSVVGVVESVPQRALVPVREPTIYSATLHGSQGANVFVRLASTAGDRSAQRLLGVLREGEVNAADAANVTFSPFEPLGTYLKSPMAARIHDMEAYFAIALGLGLLAAVIAVYSVVALDVAYRKREFAIRAACGATPRRLGLLALRRAIRLYLTAVLLGTVLTLAFAHLLSSVVAQGSAPSPIILLGSAVILAVSCSAPLLRRLRVLSTGSEHGSLAAVLADVG